MKNALKKSAEFWFFIAFVAILAIDVDESSTGAVCADEVNEYAAAFRAFGLSPQGGALSDDNARMLLYI